VTESTLKGAQGRAPPPVGRNADVDEILIRAQSTENNTLPSFFATAAVAHSALIARQTQIALCLRMDGSSFGPAAFSLRSRLSRIRRKGAS
jgi:hypothetical protein